MRAQNSLHSRKSELRGANAPNSLENRKKRVMGCAAARQRAALPIETLFADFARKMNMNFLYQIAAEIP
jgi:hypothetical protein